MTLKERFYRTASGRKVWQREKTILDLANLMCQTLETRKMSRGDLARKMGIGRRRVDEILDGHASTTIGTVSDVFTAMGYELSFVTLRAK